ncbi:MAG: AAA family ATPase [Lachnospiraceae bacterium]|nr:AAA family ATPase [Lachnospiraceae bacterium]
MNYLNTDGPYRLFRNVVNSEISVDKSMLIREISKAIGKGSRYVCITCPRRFGKSLNAQMLGASYTKGVDCCSLFENLKITQVKDSQGHRNSYNVAFADMSRLPGVYNG